MSLLHLETGSACPPLKPGVLRIYSMKFCPWAQKTRLVLAHKNIPFEVCNIHLKKKPEWLFTKNPLGKVPILEMDDKIVYDSAICNEYLDAVYPQNKLLPEDPYERSQLQMLIEQYASTVGLPIIYLLWTAADAEKLKQAQAGLETYEKLLGDGRKFFGGDDLNMLDIRMWPMLEKTDLIKEQRGVDILVANRFPLLRAWKERMLKSPAVTNGGGTDMVNMPNFRRNDGTIVDYDIGVKK